METNLLLTKKNPASTVHQNLWLSDAWPKENPPDQESVAFNDALDATESGRGCERCRRRRLQWLHHLWCGCRLHNGWLWLHRSHGCSSIVVRRCDFCIQKSSTPFARRRHGRVLKCTGRGTVVAAHGRRRSRDRHGLAAFGLRTLKPDGTHVDFKREADRQAARDYITQHKPLVVIGRPLPAELHSAPGTAGNYRYMTQTKVDQMLPEGVHIYAS